MEYSSYLLYFLGIHTRLKAPIIHSIPLEIKLCTTSNQRSILTHRHDLLLKDDGKVSCELFVGFLTNFRRH